MPAERDVIQAMINRLDALNTKVDDILRFAQPRSAVLQRVEVSPIVHEAIASARAAVGADCVGIAFTPPPLTVRADPEMMRAAVLNLLLNACQAGGESVEIAATAENGVCRIAVLDRGRGIAQDEADRVFDAFYTTKKTGTGLGLSIVRRLMELQQGTVTLRPRDGGGTVAEVTIALAAQAGAPSRDRSSAWTKASRADRRLAARPLRGGRPGRFSGHRQRRQGKHQAVRQTHHAVGHRPHARSEQRR